MEKEKLDKFNKIFELGFFQVLGGSISLSLHTIQDIVSRQIVDFSDFNQIFLTGGLNTVVEENITEHFETKLEKYNNDKESWKIAVTSGVVVGAANSFITTLIDNVYEYKQKQETENNTQTNAVKVAIEMVNHHKYHLLFKEFVPNLVEDLISTPIESYFFTINGNWIPKTFSSSNVLNKYLLVPFLLGSISKFETVIFSKPLEEKVLGIVTTKKKKHREIIETTLKDIKSKSIKGGIGCVLYTTGVQFLKPSRNVFGGIVKKLLH
ncbi:hypothetical protein M0813_08339 [Anaeramoeba flamelloides]|uniref:Uncharacterized protein n=1 Tax=Anaeramoeba flamelloides TaxID=1746091 RepID=A0ABQ8X9U1_9EUKA|nr:hypothetical protein M0813_08339 [Anaeramoeba flamelloides]